MWAQPSGDCAQLAYPMNGQQEINGIAALVDGTVEIFPFLVDLEMHAYVDRTGKHVRYAA